MDPSARPDTPPGLDDLPAVIRTSGILKLFQLAAKLHRVKEPDRAEAQDMRLSLQVNYQREGAPQTLVVDRIYVQSGEGDPLLWAACRTHPIDQPEATHGSREAAELLAKHFKGSYPYSDGMIAIPLTEL